MSVDQWRFVFQNLHSIGLFCEHQFCHCSHRIVFCPLSSLAGSGCVARPQSSKGVGTYHAAPFRMNAGPVNATPTPVRLALTIRVR